ncbi:MAG: 1,4-alpha-glucan branching enzyme [Lachnospiraceae bacterium]|nr:1,4-alpha-glucan branching enzyme [Lachnospiraceae bacterium]
MKIQDFYEGNEFEAYEYLGVHSTAEGVVFRTYAPHAYKVCLMGEWNGCEELFMEAVEDGNFYEYTVKEDIQGLRYQYRIYRTENEYSDHCDPYGFAMELRPGEHSIVQSIDTYQFQDVGWMKHRENKTSQVLNIYEVHLGSFARDEQGNLFTYEKLAERLVSHVKLLGFNYVQFLPLAEHPLDESWGYQNTGFFSPTARFGNPLGLKKLIDVCHQNGIGVIMDCMMASFAIDSYGLADYDGQPLYEYPHKDMAINEWGSCNFMHSKGEVRSFLQSCAYFWLKEYHVDGLRMGSVQRLIYWHGSKNKGENGWAIDFLKRMNQGLKQRVPECILITGNTNAFPKTTRQVAESGLGFDYQWDSSFVEDLIKYMSYSPEKRREQYYILPFSMVYFRDEHYMLALSHDDAAHRVSSLFQGIYGNKSQKFSQARAFAMFIYAHPGKKLSFMGNEFASPAKWNGSQELDWSLCQQKEHQQHQEFISSLNKIYAQEPSLYELDYEEEGFEWLDCQKDGSCMYAMKRRGNREVVYALFNFDERECREYTLNVGDTEEVQMICNSDWECFGGGSPMNREVYVPLRMNGGNQLTVTVPAFCGWYLKKMVTVQ